MTRPPLRTSPLLRIVLLCVTGLVGAAAALLIGAVAWSAPRADVPLPGRDASPEQVVRAYIDAVNARDFDTANAIDDDPSDQLGRFSRPGQIHAVHIEKTIVEGTATHVLFTADFDGGDASISDGWWGYYLTRRTDGHWHMIGAGVS